ncbi:MAG TPA: thioesterase family protein [Vicinamibacterales bacterium]|nr:thioesterase family protein [Vicinamibacterales bacterium]
MERFDYEHEIEVRFRDCDLLGHVNNAVYLSYLEQARVGYWQRLSGSSGVPRSFILARAECDYRAPATLGDRLVVRVAVASVGRSSFTLDYEVLNARTRQVVAAARTVQVMYDYDAGRSIPIPDHLRAKLKG